LPLYNRTVTLLVAEPGQAGVLIEGLKVKFVVKKSNRPEPNTALIQVYNLGPTTRNKLGTTGTVATLQAGYIEDSINIRIIAEMDVVGVETVRQRPDVITVIACQDGVNAMRNNKASHSYGANTSAKKIVTDVAKSAGLVLRSLGEVVDDTYANGFSESGPINDIFDKLAGKMAAQWSMQNGEVQFAPLDRPASSTIIKLNKESGLIGSPQRRNKLGSPENPAQKDGWICRSLLQGQIEPESLLKIESEEVDSQFRVVAVEHRGDNRGAEFYSEVEVEEYARQ
jgi:hypothetical protein